MNPKGVFAIAKREFLSNLKSIRMLILLILFALAVVGGAYGLAVLSVKPEMIPDSDLAETLSTGPNAVLFMSALFIAFVGSISAVSLSFDSIVKEKLQNSLDLLLCRPLSKREILFGKFLGLWAALSLPGIIMLLAAILCVASVAGMPSTKMTLGFIIFTVIFFGIFISIQQIFSTVSKTLGTAILSGIGVWFLFTMFWVLVSLSIAYLMGMPMGTIQTNPDYNLLRSRIDLFSPIGAYDLSLGVLAGGKGILPEGIPYYAPFLSLFLWFFIPLLISMEVFHRRTE
ncbi:MAG: ABC transporter permease [Thermoplasmatales archaeon]|nr:ABC transporter permease [Candidatus Thermoplasmatota archaeon]MCG2826462.1 ABC transporter permease [Thermoplasmatales archaeon]